MRITTPISGSDRDTAGIAICLRFSTGFLSRLTYTRDGSQLNTVVLTRIKSTAIQNPGMDRPTRPSTRAARSMGAFRRVAERMPSGNATLAEMSMASIDSSSVMGSACTMSGTTGRRERNE